MNDICKQRIRERLIEAQKKERLPNGVVASLLGVTPNVVCCAKNPKYWRNFSDVKWEVLQRGCNSGLSIVAYSKGNGHFVAPENMASEQNVQKDTVAIAEEVVKADLDITARMQNIAQSVPEPEKVVTPSYEYVPKKEVIVPRLSKGQMVDLLLKEKELLRQKIDAIDVLLKFYIS